MPVRFEINASGATEEQVNDMVDALFRMRVSRGRQPTLVFDAENKGQLIGTLRRTSNDLQLEGEDRKTLRGHIKALVNTHGTVLVGLVESSSARETHEEN